MIIIVAITITIVIIIIIITIISMIVIIAIITTITIVTNHYFGYYYLNYYYDYYSFYYYYSFAVHSSSAALLDPEGFCHLQCDEAELVRVFGGPQASTHTLPQDPQLRPPGLPRSPTRCKGEWAARDRDVCQVAEGAAAEGVVPGEERADRQPWPGAAVFGGSMVGRPSACASVSSRLSRP